MIVNLTVVLTSLDTLFENSQCTIVPCHEADNQTVLTTTLCANIIFADIRLCIVKLHYATCY